MPSCSARVTSFTVCLENRSRPPPPAGRPWRDSAAFFDSVVVRASRRRRARARSPMASIIGRVYRWSCPAPGGPTRTRRWLTGEDHQIVSMDRLGATAAGDRLSSTAASLASPLATRDPSGPTTSTAAPGSKSPLTSTTPTGSSERPCSTSALTAPASMRTHPSERRPKAIHSLRAGRRTGTGVDPCAYWLRRQRCPDGVVVCRRSHHRRDPRPRPRCGPPPPWWPTPRSRAAPSHRRRPGRAPRRYASPRLSTGPPGRAGGRRRADPRCRSASPAWWRPPGAPPAPPACRCRRT